MRRYVILIDGYNMMAHSKGLTGATLASIRRELISDLVEYRAARNHDVRVVFDGRSQGGRPDVNESRGGVEVLFSRPPETADDVIARESRQLRERAVVVTSDRRVAREAEWGGATAVSVEAFEDRLDAALKGAATAEEESEGLPASDSARKGKRGNPRKLSKEERARKRVLARL